MTKALISGISGMDGSYLAELLIEKGYDLIDCQQETDHMKSLGAKLMSKEEFYTVLKENMSYPDKVGVWNLE